MEYLKIPYKEHPCVYKLYYNDFFIICKSKDMQDGIKRIQRSLKSFLEGNTTIRQDNPYLHFFNQVAESPDGTFKYEIIIESNNPYTLLVAEQKAINENAMNPYCLNNNFVAYIPQYNNETGQYGWINRGYVLNFLRWLKKNSK